MLEIEALNVSIGDSAILHDVSLSVGAGEKVVVVGASGSGKSTLARTILGLPNGRVRLDAKALRIDGSDLPAPRSRAWRSVRGRRVGYVPQDPGSSLNPVRRIKSQVREALQLTGQPYSDREVALRLAEAGLSDPTISSRYPHELSGGQRQRVLIAIALAGRPGLVVADEPTSALDADVANQVLDVLTSSGTGLLLITHDLTLVGGRADRVVVFDQGRVVEEAPALSLLSSPSSSAAKALKAAMPGRRVPQPIPEPHEVVLSASNVSVRLGGTTILDEVDVSVHRGETLAVVGPSGSGKSTLARVLTGLTAPTAGTVWRDGRVQLVSQNPFSALDPRWTVERIVAESLHPSLGLSASDRRERVGQALDEVGLGSTFLSRRPSELSGGQSQRVAIARALASHPAAVVLDEAVSALDVVSQARVLDILERLQAVHGISYVFITHNLTVAHDIAHRFVQVNAGRVIESASAAV
ncbi:putative ABC transporter ATP-binding protein [Gordonia effusa NBRC 100432]|uniref:Putative ABC transporter ATP-binding protein n=1 Tax=Gordonia effusa NBRC 100432 TaxID=1077974 RepID=H0QZ91_9ACTN|nr:ABC transporter ATP-binding protein [Gordonia effusa]GAB18142.1 putative ABC transporter ATP-binding protein [Gordonia effusa NBRC 100432]